MLWCPFLPIITPILVSQLLMESLLYDIAIGRYQLHVKSECAVRFSLPHLYVTMAFAYGLLICVSSYEGTSGPHCWVIVFSLPLGICYVYYHRRYGYADRETLRASRHIGKLREATRVQLQEILSFQPPLQEIQEIEPEASRIELELRAQRATQQGEASCGVSFFRTSF